MLSEKDIIARIRRNPGDLLPVEWARLEIESDKHAASVDVDLFMKILFRNKSIDIVAEVFSGSSRAVFINKINQVKNYASLCKASPLLIAPYFNPKERALCRDQNVFFLDLSGNQWFSVEGLLIEREGFKNQFPEERLSRNPFSDKASLIIRELISEYKKIRGVRELADLLELSPGYVSKMAGELERLGYIQKSAAGIRLQNPKELLADWVAHYSVRDNRQHKYFLSALGVDEVINEIRKLDLQKSDYAFSAQAGANLVYQYASYDVVHVYVKDEEVHNSFADSLSLQSVDRRENLILMDPRYKKSVFYKSRKIQGISVVSDLQLYLDLYHYPKRGREQAEKIFEEKLLPLWEE